jgi:glycosyltransferase involved in cell wall biosynthesis
MKILFIAHDSLRTGSGCCLYELLSQLQKGDGITPVVLCHNNNLLSETLKKDGIETYCCRFGYSYAKNFNPLTFFFWGKIYRHIANLFTYLYLRLKMNLKSIDVIYSNSGIIDFGAYLHRKINKPLVWHLRELERLEYEPVMPDFAHYVNSNALKVITVSKALKKHFVELGVNEDKLQCVYDGVVGSKYCYTKKNNNSSLLKICMVGRLSPAKGQIIAIEALKLIPKQYLEKIQLDFYGYGAIENELKQLALAYGLNKQISFKGYCSNVNETIVEYDIGLNLSFAEGFGRTTVEYMLEGLYVIAANGGATPEILGYGKYGSLINSSNDLAEEIIKIMEGKLHYEKIAFEGQKYALETFDIEKNYKNILSVVRECTE